MSRLIRACKINPVLSILVFTLSIVGFNLFYTQPTAAYTAPRNYTIYQRGSNNIYFNGSAWTLISWDPRVNITKQTCGAGFSGTDEFDSTHDYTDCIGITIQEDSGASNLWYEQAYYSYEINDFDHTETISIGGGYIYDWGSSLDSVSSNRRFARSHSGDTSANCDSPNWNDDNKCSVLILFRPDGPTYYQGDFSIRLDNDANDPSHEYGYKGPKTSTYYHLYFNPNGGSVADAPADSSTLVSHMSGANVLREYAPADTADTFPQPTWGSRAFLGWYTAPTGGSRVTSRTMNSDETLYAHWIEWYITPSVSVDKSIAYPGDLVTWTHTVVNDGPDNTHLSVAYDYINAGSFSTPYANGSDTSIAAGWQPYWANRKSKTSPYTVMSSDGGKNLCRATRVWPGAAGDSTLRTSGGACSYVPYNFLLTPTVDVDPKAIELGSTLNISGNVANSLPAPNSSRNTQSTPIQYRITKMVIPSSVASAGVAPNIFFSTPTLPLGPFSHPNEPCPAGTGFFKFSGITCSNVAGVSLTSNIIPAGGNRSTGTINDTSTDYPVGTRLCYAFSVQRRAARSNASGADVFDDNWAHSGLQCAVIGHRPKVQIWGSDLISGAAVRTSQSVKGSTGNTFGSWVEYAIFARGLIRGTGSASAFYDNTNGLPGSTISKYSRLSFSNTSAPAPCTVSPNVGCYYNSAPTMPSIEKAFSGTGSVSGSVDLGSIAAGVYSSSSASLAINGGTITSGKYVVINAPSSNITINSNINYDSGSFSSIKDIPQVVIIANSISIADGVTNIDSWLIAKTSASSYINTCSSIPVTGNPPLSSATCSSPLRVNGPVQTSKLYLRRTAGAAGTGEPAEIFDLRADAYLWAISRSMSTDRIKTVYSKSLPARY